MSDLGYLLLVMAKTQFVFSMQLVKNRHTQLLNTTSKSHWKGTLNRIIVGKDRKPHPHSFFRDGDEKRTVKVKIDGTAGKDNIQARISAGVNDLLVLKSSGSSFTSFIRDEYTRVKGVDDRLFATSVDQIYTFAPIIISPPKDENKPNIVIPALDQAEAGSIWDATIYSG
ncbi:MAG: hypothetical protein NXY57DRAFT_1041467 [Lentinula lateritia]|uniref:factor independent urate hydroxylase n=1 Tax=Lentinula lateritia TaxID=40482 RepID=A0ABQ8V3P1_9AGAR|nr:MAG: hypothetical protein NXY57DRAFT_1041467 [Lentinula lateritia]KAJ4471192.1 hypothetical protein C8R41DRAFT_969137 [Lentinula lateritia]